MVTEVAGGRLVISDRTKLPTRTVVWCVGVFAAGDIAAVPLLETR